MLKYNLDKYNLNRYIVVVSGPTGVGKTDFVRNIDKAIKKSIEIINADVGQFYKKLDIGTAKPDIGSEKHVHHLFDFISEPVNFSAADYKAIVEKLVLDIWSRNKVPVIVGGSSFYVKSLFFALPENPEIKDLDKNNIEIDLDKFNTQSLWDKLYAIDPDRAKDININDRYRIERALILWYTTKRLPSLYKAEFKPISDFYYIFLNRDREDLYNRINERVDIMLNCGWIEEVKNLDKNWIEFLKFKKLIGYPEIVKYLNKEYENIEDLSNIIKKQTRNYAKRQITFWRSLKKDLEKSLKDSKYQGLIEEINLTCK